MKTALVSGADRNLGLEICRELLRLGWIVYAGQYIESLGLLQSLAEDYPPQLKIIPLDCSSDSSVTAALGMVEGTLDMMVHNAADFGGSLGDITGEFNFIGLERPFNVNALGAVRLTERAAPLMENSGMKRMCYVSSEAGVISVSHRKAVSGYGMSKTALNMAVRTMFNRLRPLGYTFRLYHPGWVRSPKITVSGESAQANGLFEPQESAVPAVRQFIEDRDWEDMLVMVDNEDAAWPF
jgi:NAD(P)-dependent dehydrogenase (short-subunit alcohol dehydrogenase family)